MIETFVVAFTTFFATVGPLDVAALFAVLVGEQKSRARMAIRGVFIATLVLVIFALSGDFLLKSLGITLPALRIAGGVLLLLLAIEMVFARTSGGSSTTDEEESEALKKVDISVFPLATPLIAGPGAMGAVILLMADSQGDILQQTMVMVALLLVMMLTLAMLLLAPLVTGFLGVTGLHVVGRVMGVLLSALAVQFVLDGLIQAGLLSA